VFKVRMCLNAMILPKKHLWQWSDQDGAGFAVSLCEPLRSCVFFLTQFRS
jgi:hypothetical protein